MKTLIYLTKEYRYCFINKDTNKVIGEVEADNHHTLEYLLFIRGLKSKQWDLIKDTDFNVWCIENGEVTYYLNRINPFVTGV